MAFTNLQVSLDELPSFEDIDYLELEPSYARLVCAVIVAVECLVVINVLTVSLLRDVPWQLEERLVPLSIIALLFFVVFPIYRFKAVRAIRYAIRDHDLLLKSGLFWRKEIIQPIRRIQHVELTRGPLEKRLGLASIGLFSAGSGKATFTIPGLRVATAARTRRFILQSERS